MMSDNPFTVKYIINITFYVMYKVDFLTLVKTSLAIQQYADKLKICLTAEIRVNGNIFLALQVVI